MIVTVAAQECQTDETQTFLAEMAAGTRGEYGLTGKATGNTSHVMHLWGLPRRTPPMIRGKQFRDACTMREQDQRTHLLLSCLGMGHTQAPREA